MEKQKHIPVNALWRIRQGSGLELKQAAKLLGHRSTDSLSNYENSNSCPNLQNVIKLMLIYNSDLKEMFPDLFERCRKEVEKNLKKSASILSIKDRENLAEHINSCTYEDIASNPNLTENDRNIIRSHVTKLARKLAYL
jgi:hypothetical protein